MPYGDILRMNLVLDSKSFFNYYHLQDSLPVLTEYTSGKLNDLMDLQNPVSSLWFHGNKKLREQFKTISALKEANDELMINNMLPVQCKKILGQPVSDKEKQFLIVQLLKFAPYSGSGELKAIEKSIDSVDISSLHRFWEDEWMEVYFSYEGKSKDIMNSFGAGGLYNQSFSTAINHYLSTNLKYKSEFPYKILNLETRPWEWEHLFDISKDLTHALSSNPFLKVVFHTGYYDGSMLDKKVQMWQLDPEGKFQDRIFFQGYNSGHVMYVDKFVRKKINQDLRDFILTDANTGFKSSGF